MRAFTAVLLALLALPAGAAAIELSEGFGQTEAISGLGRPTSVRFAADGRVFIAEQSGRIKIFDSLADPTPTIFADLRPQVHDWHDRGLLAIELHPDFPAEPWVYALYAYDTVLPGGPARASDTCPSEADGCAIQGRLVRLRAEGDLMTEEQVLVQDWCQQFPVHSMGDLHFGPDGALYASGGEGGNSNLADAGQLGDPANACGDPVGEGGSLRSQDVAGPGDPVGLNGSVVRLDPETGEAAADNPAAGAADANQARILGYGFRNPFRFAIRPGSDELWVGDVGRVAYEEIDVVSPGAPTARNYGWPCLEGPLEAFKAYPLCTSLQAAGTATPAWLAYQRQSPVAPADTCVPGSGSITGVAFAPMVETPYPEEMRGALFWADYGRRCIWYAPQGADGRPVAAEARTFATHVGSAVQLVFGPGGELFWLDVWAGTLERIGYIEGNAWPTALVDASATEGDLPLTVQFDGTRSTDPDGDDLEYAWDLDGDGAFDDSTEAEPAFEYTAAGAYDARLRVSDPGGASATAGVTIAAGGEPPVASLDVPPRWTAGEPLALSGGATDAEDGELADDALSWSLVVQHCPADCHVHPLDEWEGAGRTIEAPPHEYPAHLELRLTATDSTGMEDTATAALYPRTVELGLRSDPPGLPLELNGATAPTPFARTLIRGATASLAAPPIAGELAFSGWSDGGPAAHDIAAAADATYTATYGEPSDPAAPGPAAAAGDGPGPSFAGGPFAPPVVDPRPRAIGARLGVPPRVFLPTLLRHGLRLTLRTAVPGRATLTLRSGRRVAGRRAEDALRSGLRTFVLRPSRAARRRLRARRRVTLHVAASVVAADGRTESVARRTRAARP